MQPDEQELKKTLQLDRALLRVDAERHHRPGAREGGVQGEGPRHSQAYCTVVQRRHGGRTFYILHDCNLTFEKMFNSMP